MKLLFWETEVSIDEKDHNSPFVVRAADLLAAEVINLVKEGKLDARSKAADASLDYASIRFRSQDPIHDLLEYVEKNYRPAR